MRLLSFAALIVIFVIESRAEDDEVVESLSRQKRSYGGYEKKGYKEEHGGYYSSYGKNDGYGKGGYGKSSGSIGGYGGGGDDYGKGYGYQKNEGYGESYHKSSGYGYKKKTLCYQCSWGPPKRYKVKYEYKHQGYGYHGKEGSYGKGYLNELGSDAGYTPCKGPFTHYEAQAAGLDVWACGSNCYTRVDKNGHIFRGCFKGEYGVNPYKLGCHYQGDSGSTYCFCKGDKCNNDAAPYH